MIAKKRHAGETAKKGGARATAGKAKRGGAAKWRTVATKGGTVLISPTGERYHGTAAEVRAAHIAPRWRDYLARQIWLAKSVERENPAELEKVVAEHRREIIMFDHADRTDAAERDRDIMYRACARYLCQTVEQFEREMIHEQISSLIEYAISEKDTDIELQGFLTRHEREALTTPLSDWCDYIAFKTKIALKKIALKTKGAKA